MRGGVGIFGQLLGPFFGFCTEKLRFFGFVVRCSFRFSVLFAIKNKGGKIPLWVSVQSDVRLFYVSQFYSQSKSNCNVVCIGRLSTESTPRRPTNFGGSCSSILSFGPYVPQITNKFEI